MKISSPNFKNLDVKKLAVDHGEKVVVGLIALFVLFALYGTRWMPYSRTPEELIQMTDGARESVKKRDWPAADRQALEEQEPVVVKAKQMLEPVQSAAFAYRAPMWAPLFQPKQKNGEPKWLPPEHAVASAGRLPLFVPTAVVQPETTPAANATMAEKDSNVPPEFRTRGDNTGKAGAARLPGGRAGGSRLQIGNSDAEEKEEAAREEAERKAAIKAAEQQNRERNKRGKRNKKDDDDRGYAGSAGGAGKTQGRRFVSVRAIIPINRQYLMLAKAFHEPVAQNLEATLTLLDFELQRQKVRTDGTWTDWEPVDISIAKEILADSGGFDAEIVSPAVTDPTVTMPLPPRAMGQWGKDVASHKDIENFELTEEEMDAYVEIQEKVMAAMEEKQKNQPQPETPPVEVVQAKGWNDIQWNEKKALKEMQSKVDETAKEMASSDAGNTRQALIDEIKAKVKVEGQLILFRYFDFGVEPGFAYRYRVRIIYNNPNYNLGLDRVADPAFASGPVRPTDWSEPTPPVIVPFDSKQFLAGVEPAPAGKEPRALIDVFQWDPDAGTTINSVLPTRLGQFVGGKAKTPRLLPAEELFEDADAQFVSNDALVDVVENPRLNYEEHPDLGFTKPLRGGRIDITNQALLVDQNGEFAVLDPLSAAGDRATAQQILGFERGPFMEIYKAWQQSVKAEKAALEEEKRGFSAEAAAGDDKKGKNKRRRNSSMRTAKPRGNNR